MTRSADPRRWSALAVIALAGLAVMTAIATSQGAEQLNVTALTDGYQAAFIGVAAIAIAGTLLAAALLRIPKAGPPGGPARGDAGTPPA